MDIEKEIREIEKTIDVFHSNSNFLKSYTENRNQALFDLLRVYEGLSSSLLVGGTCQGMLGLQNFDLVLLQNVHNIQDALNTAIKWIFSCCNISSEDFSFDLDEHVQSEATELLVKYADPYSVIVDGYIGYSRKQNTARIENRTVYFDSTPEQLASFIHDVGERLDDNQDKLAAEIETMCMSPQFQQQISKLSETINTEEGRLCYEVDGDFLDDTCKIAEKQWTAKSDLPQEWKFEGFSLLSFKKCWKVLYGICLIHFIARIKSKIPGMAMEDAVVVLPRDIVVRCLENRTSVQLSEINAIIDILIYDSKLKNTDIMYQPIIAVNENLILTPNLFMTSNPERNLIAVIQKKNDAEYSSEVNELEDRMVNELIGKLPNDTTYCKAKYLSRELPDVDFSIFDPLTNSIFLAEMKWLIAADSTKEVLERQKDIDHGCLQIEQIMSHAMQNPISFAKRLFDIDLQEVPDLFWCVVAKHDIRSTNNRVPVISLSRIQKLISNYSLSKVFHTIRNREYYKPLPKEVYLDHKKVQYGGYEFAIPALVIQKEYEV